MQNKWHTYTFMRGSNSVAKNLEHQTVAICFFLHPASDIKVAQFLLGKYTPNFSNLGALQSLNNENHPIWPKIKIVDFRMKLIINIDCFPGHLNPRN